MSATVQGSAGRGHNAGEGLPRVTIHRGNNRHGIACGKAPTQTRTDKQIAFANIRRGGYVMNLQRRQRTVTLCDRSHTVAIYLNRNGVRRISDEQDPCIQRTHLNDLPHQSVGIDQRLPQLHPVVLTFIDDQLLTRWIGGHTNHLCHQHIIA